MTAAFIFLLVIGYVAFVLILGRVVGFNQFREVEPGLQCSTDLAARTTKVDLMNYYEHHIGDYAEATAHLNFIEDAAYSRLIRKYYSTEKPLPAEISKVQRLVGAKTKEEKISVEVVLKEFFILEEDGWHNKRCDFELEKYFDGNAEREKKVAHEKERLRRYREERARLFDELRVCGITPKWDIKYEQLKRLHERTCNAPVLSTGQVQERTCNAPATANQTPDTNTQYPIPNTHIIKDTLWNIPTRAGAVCVSLRAEGLASVNPSHPDLLALLDDGAEIQEFVSAARIAKERGKGFPYVIGIVKGQRADAQRMAAEAKTKPKGATHDGHDVEEPA